MRNTFHYSKYSHRCLLNNVMMNWKYHSKKVDEDTDL